MNSLIVSMKCLIFEKVEFIAKMCFLMGFGKCSKCTDNTFLVVFSGWIQGLVWVFHLENYIIFKSIVTIIKRGSEISKETSFQNGKKMVQDFYWLPQTRIMIKPQILRIVCCKDSITVQRVPVWWDPLTSTIRIRLWALLARIKPNWTCLFSWWAKLCQ